LAGTALPRRLTWQLATVVGLVDETPRTRSIVLDHPTWAGHRAGQHVDVRLTAEDGYQAQRSYSIASEPEDEHLVLTVERLDDGEVSPYLVDDLIPGDPLELRGPIGGYFIWEESLGGPLVLVAGGSGIVPLHAMLRHWAAGTTAAALRVRTDLVRRERRSSPRRDRTHPRPNQDRTVRTHRYLTTGLRLWFVERVGGGVRRGE